MFKITENKSFKIKPEKWYNVRIDIQVDHFDVWANVEGEMPELIFGPSGVDVNLHFTDDYAKS
jgi:hypothetical protein